MSYNEILDLWIKLRTYCLFELWFWSFSHSIICNLDKFECCTLTVWYLDLNRSLWNCFYSSTCLEIWAGICSSFSSFFLQQIHVVGDSTRNKTGKKTRAWNIPNRTVKKNTLKKVISPCEVESQRRMTARNVVVPPFMTAGPIIFRAFWMRSKLDPNIKKNTF